METVYPKTRTTRSWYDVVNDTRHVEEIYYETLINPHVLNQMAQRAAKNKSQRCRDGALEVRILERKSS